MSEPGDTEVQKETPEEELARLRNDKEVLKNYMATHQGVSEDAEVHKKLSQKIAELESRLAGQPTPPVSPATSETPPKTPPIRQRIFPSGVFPKDNLTQKTVDKVTK